MKGFEYEITMKVLLSKYRINGDIEFMPVDFNSATRKVINSGYNLDRSSQEILYRIYNWINEESGWIIKSIQAQYVNTSIYNPLSGRK